MLKTQASLLSVFITTLICFICDVTVVVGQSANHDMHFDQLTIKDGLSHNSVRCLLQDYNGYIWIGTQNGLNKYDGYDFKIYKSNELENNKDGFVGNNITALFEDSQHNLWVGTSKNGINFRDKLSDKFINFKADTTFEKLGDFPITSIYEDRENFIWISSIGAGMIKYNPKTKESIHYNTENSGLSTNLVFDIVQDNSGLIWVATGGNGIYCLKDNNQFELYNPELIGYPNMNGFRKTFHLDGDELWLATEGTGLYKINLLNKESTRFYKDQISSISSDAIMDIQKTHDGQLIIATNGNGLNILDLQSKSISYYNQQNNNLQTLNSNSLDCLLEDRTGNIWIGTYNGGLNIYKPHKTYFDLEFPTHLGVDQLQNKSVLSIAQDQSNGIYFGTDGGGLNYIKAGEADAEIVELKTNSAKDNPISGKVVKTIFEDKDQQIWLGLFTENTVIYNPQTKKVKNFPAARSVWDIDGNSKGEICLGTIGDGIVIYDSVNETTVSRRYNPEDQKSLASNLIMSVLYDDNDQLWIGTADEGLDIYNSTTDEFQHYKHTPSDSTSLSSNEVRVIYQDRRGEVWIGTEGGGLNKYLGEGKFEHVWEAHGLIANSVMGICEDQDGALWITTFVGISKYDPNTKSIQNFDFRTSQNLNQFNQMSILASADNKLFFGGTNGLHSIEAGEVKKPSKNINILFTELEVSNKPVSAGPLSNGNVIIEEPIEIASEINLSYSDNSFSIMFSAIDYTSNHENIYEYMLEGFDEDWQFSKPNMHSASYTNLDPGEYLFKVKYRDGEASKRIIFNPPFYKTFLFRLLLTLFVLALLIGSLVLLIKRREATYKRQMLKLEKEKLETSVEAKNEKLMFFAVQMAHKNEILTDIKNELKTSFDSTDSNTGKLINKLDRELKNEDYWADFKVYFNVVDQDFITSFQEEYPNLTTNDLRMCSLIRMNLSNKEIASLCNISTRGVEQSKYRLKKRLNLKKSEDLIRFISLYKN